MDGSGSRVPDATRGGGAGGARRRGAGADRRLAGSEPKIASRPPFRMGSAPKEIGGHEELIGGLGSVVEAPAEEIIGEGRSSGSVPWCGGVEERRSSGERCGEGRELWGSLYRWRGEGDGTAEAVGWVPAVEAAMSAVELGGAVSTGKGEGAAHRCSTVHLCTLKGRGRRGRGGDKGGRGEERWGGGYGDGWRRSEVEDGPDSWAPPVREHVREEEDGVGRRE
jgi:hypothetical protein